ncbi:aminotransferase class IV [Hathewaya histolytica]|uniref:Branched-chain amino acid aminotransferase n=2 Tax=Hathewaya histolytica TaxID=1498 RepID=A0A4U9R8U1_HATHI|nr:aminotransferase class IV [Hathewaya histolytica]VTQ87496.1 branched-chain amino acid aminotransferase [Hathewaya histolytica]
MSSARKQFYIFNGSLEKEEKNLEEILNQGDIVYEVIRIIEGFPLFLKEHMDRLHNSCSLINIQCPIKQEEVFRHIRELSASNEIDFGNIKIVLNSNSLEYAIYFIPHYYPTEEEYEDGVKTILYNGERKNPNAKIVDMSFRKTVTEKIKKENAYEAILIDKNGNITEGSKSNIFMVKGDVVLTAPVEGVLPGITRNKIINVIKDLGISFEEKYVKDDEINSLQGLFISGTSPKVLPINKVETISFNPKNKIIIDIMKFFNKVIEEDIKFIKNNYFK